MSGENIIYTFKNTSRKGGIVPSSLVNTAAKCMYLLSKSHFSTFDVAIKDEEDCNQTRLELTYAYN